MFSTYDHRTLKTRLPVRSALFKQRTGGLVVRWVTTSEYPLLYVFELFFDPFAACALSCQVVGLVGGFPGREGAARVLASANLSLGSGCESISRSVIRTGAGG
jgi:hypothetical protein